MRLSEGERVYECMCACSHTSMVFYLNFAASSLFLLHLERTGKAVSAPLLFVPYLDLKVQQIQVYVLFFLFEYFLLDFLFGCWGRFWMLDVFGCWASFWMFLDDFKFYRVKSRDFLQQF